MRNIDFSSWQSVLATLIGIALLALIGVGVRVLVMVSIQQRRERLNRQINERLRTLIAAYKVLGGSFTGNLAVDPRHRRDLKRGAATEAPPLDLPAGDEDDEPGQGEGSDRRRRIRDTVEAALSDIILLGTEEQVRLAERAARELVAGRPVHTHELVVSLRAFIRKALDIAPIPADLQIPAQGPARPAATGSRGGNRERGDRGGEGRQSGGGRGGGGGMGAAAGGMGGGLALGATLGDGEPGTDASETPAADPRA